MATLLDDPFDSGGSGMPDNYVDLPDNNDFFTAPDFNVDNQSGNDYFAGNDYISPGDSGGGYFDNDGNLHLPDVIGYEGDSNQSGPTGQSFDFNLNSDDGFDLSNGTMDDLSFNPPGEYTPGATSKGSSKAKNLTNLGKLLAAALAKKKGKDTTNQSGTSTTVDTNFFPGGEGSQAQFQDFLGGMLDDYALPNHGINISTPHVSASHYQASHATASLIDMLDKAFQVEPDANIREDVYSRLKSGASAGADNAIMHLMDSARSSGAGPNAPWVQQLAMEARKKANQSSTQGLTDFFDSWIQAALGRRAGALSTNAQLQTGVNTFNAGADNAASQFNAASNNSASALNAQLGLQSQVSRAGLQNQSLDSILRALEFGSTPIRTGSTTTTNQTGTSGGNQNNAGYYAQLLQSVLDSYGRK